MTRSGETCTQASTATAEDSIIERLTVSPFCSIRASVATGYSLCDRGSAFVSARAGEKPVASRQATASAHRSARDRHGASQRLESARRMHENR
ncbi:hypothetical protein ASE61_09450 [Bosea sp. Root670]|nr:hypothetical protein ASE61_09450 [Bosea sp. Root670]